MFVHIPYGNAGDDFMYCPQHDVRVEFQPDRKATSPLDAMHWYMCPGLDAELSAEGKYNQDKYAQELEDRDGRDRAQWVYVIEVDEEAVVAVSQSR